MPVEQALAELARCSGTHFDPAVVDALLAHLAGA
jgi:HD-GYP domain-containing protein (c-di-GMP phosphodiesterase class II)